MSARSTGGVIGACPSIEEPFEAADGLLVRLRVPGGRLSGDQARVVSEAAQRGSGVIEITSRANLQLRGFSSAALSAVASMLGRSFPARVDVMTSPTAGVDRAELVDTGSLVVALMAGLGGMGAMSPKLAVVVDGGGRVHLRDRPCDVGLGALRLSDGTVAFELRVGEAIPTIVDADEELVVIAADRAVAAVVEVVASCGPTGRAADLVDEVGRAAVTARLEFRLGSRLVRRRAGEVHRPGGLSAPAVGLLDRADAALVSIGVAPLLGRMDPATLDAVASVAGCDRPGELRLTPWRGLVVPSVHRSAAPSVLAALGSAGFVCGADDPALTVVACAGSSGCAAGLADTQADGRAVVAHLRRAPAAERPQAVHLSGCPKRCASHRRDELVLLAGPEPGTYVAHRGSGEPMTAAGAGAVEALSMVGCADARGAGPISTPVASSR